MLKNTSYTIQTDQTDFAHEHKANTCILLFSQGIFYSPPPPKKNKNTDRIGLLNENTHDSLRL